MPYLFHWFSERFKKQGTCKKADEKGPGPWRLEKGDGKFFLTTWYAEIINVLIQENVETWSKRGYN